MRGLAMNDDELRARVRELCRIHGGGDCETYLERRARESSWAASCGWLAIGGVAVGGGGLASLLVAWLILDVL